MLLFSLFYVLMYILYWLEVFQNKHIGKPLILNIVMHYIKYAFVMHIFNVQFNVNIHIHTVLGVIN